jgi:UDP-N-acetylglucosamine 2-epimerase
MLFAPCITVCPYTEQESTIEAGANSLCHASRDAIADAVGSVIAENRAWVTPKRWDQTVSDRVVRSLKRGIMPLS